VKPPPAESRHVDLLVRNGLVVTSRGTEVTNIGIADGLIVGLGDRHWQATAEIDATGLIVLPGGVDPHTHLNHWPFGDERSPEDDFGSGTRAAVAGGITTVCDFVYTLDTDSTLDTITRLENEAGATSRADFTFHIAITTLREETFDEVPAIIDAGFSSFKFYTQLDDYTARGTDYLRLLELIGKLGGTAMFHCEDRALIEYCGTVLRRDGHVSPRYYPEAKPIEIEAAATAQALSYAAVTGVPAYIVHLSSAAALEQVRAARSRGAKVFVETRPLYLYLSDRCFDTIDAEAALYVGTPPLRTDHDREQLWRSLTHGEIDTVGSDHVGFTRAQKYHVGDSFETVPKGVSNMQTMIPMLYSEGVRAGRLTLQQLAATVAGNPARIFGLYPRKGTIALGSDADLCLLDPKSSRPVASAEMHSASDFDLFEGWNVVGWPVMTLLRGRIAFADGEFALPAGSGRLVVGEAGATRRRNLGECV
jgi:dihydropyrimidinase